jgi:hypothetical protein
MFKLALITRGIPQFNKFSFKVIIHAKIIPSISPGAHGFRSGSLAQLDPDLDRMRVWSKIPKMMNIFTKERRSFGIVVYTYYENSIRKPFPVDY